MRLIIIPSGRLPPLSDYALVERYHMNDTPNRILVVDDEPSITEFVSYALKKEGF